MTGVVPPLLWVIIGYGVILFLVADGLRPQ